MGLNKSKRPVYAPAFITNTTDTTPGSGYLTARFVQGNPVIASSAIQTILSSAIASSSTDAALTAITAVAQVATIQSTGTGAGWEVKLSTGRTIGTTVLIAVACQTTVPVTVLLESTTQNLFGSTFNALTWSTDSSGTAVTLTKLSATEYAGVWDAAKVTPGGSTGTV